MLDERLGFDPDWVSPDGRTHFHYSPFVARLIATCTVSPTSGVCSRATGMQTGGLSADTLSCNQNQAERIDQPDDHGVTPILSMASDRRLVGTAQDWRSRQGQVMETVR